MSADDETTMTMLLVIAMIAAIVMLIARAAVVGSGIASCRCCCGGLRWFAVVLCVGRSVMCAGLREGRHLMRVAAGVVILPFTCWLEEDMFPVWSCC